MTDTPIYQNRVAEHCGRFRKSVLSVRCAGSMGTGWIAGLSKGGFAVATALHVVEAAEEGADVELWHEDRTSPIICRRQPGMCYVSREADLAIQLVPGTAPGPSLSAYYYRSSVPGEMHHPDVPLGTEVAWLGYPESTHHIFGGPTLTLGRGHVSATGRRGEEFIYCVDGMVNRGMSGGPVWDSEGHVLGMVVEYVAPFLSTPDEDPYPIPFPGLGVIIPSGYLMVGFHQHGANFFGSESNPGQP